MDNNTTDDGAIVPHSREPSEARPTRSRRHGKKPSRDREDRSRLALATAIITLVGAVVALIGALLPLLLLH